MFPVYCKSTECGATKWLFVDIPLRDNGILIKVYVDADLFLMKALNYDKRD